MKIFISIIFYLILINDLSSQSITWQRYYDGPNNYDDYGHKICKADGDNFYLIGSSWLPPDNSGIYIIKINSLGQLLWTRLLYSGIVGHTGVSTDDGGCIISGANDTSYTLKINKDGDVLWYKTYVYGFPQIYDIIRTSDNGFIACGEIGLQDGHIFKTDSSGNLQWQKTYTSGSYKWFNNIIEIEDGFLLVGHDVDTSIVGEGTLTKINYAGKIQWEKRYSISGFSFFSKQIIKYNNTYKLFGNGIDVQKQTLSNEILTVDSLGNIIDTTFITPPPEWEYQLIEAYNDDNNNRYIISSIVNKPGLTDTPYVELRILDENNNSLYVKSFISGDFSSLESIIRADNGDYLFAGYLGRFDVNHSDVYAIRTDSMLNAPPVGITPINLSTPVNFILFQNYPNPFNPTTTINYAIPKDMMVKIKVYDISGREITSLVNELKQAGNHSVSFNGHNLASGVYLYKIEVGDFVQTKKMLLIK